MSSLPIAYVNVDSLLQKYSYAKEMNERMICKEESSRTELNEKASVFQKDAMEFQRKVNNNGFLSRERAASEQNRLAKAEQDLQELRTKLSNDLMREQDRVNRELRDSVVNFLEIYSVNKYEIVLSNTLGDNVLYSQPGVDITNKVVAELNKRYSSNKKE